MPDDFVKQFLDQVSKQPTHQRRLVLLKPDEKAPKSLSTFPVPEGMREETDEELRERIKADRGGGI